MYAIQLVFSVPVYDNHWPRREILIKVTLSNYNGSTNVGHLKAVIPNQICITWRVTLVNNYHRACWVSCANMIFVLKIVAVNLMTMTATRAEEYPRVESSESWTLISESWILWQNTFPVSHTIRSTHNEMQSRNKVKHALKRLSEHRFAHYVTRGTIKTALRKTLHSCSVSLQRIGDHENGPPPHPSRIRVGRIIPLPLSQAVPAWLRPLDQYLSPFLN